MPRLMLPTNWQRLQWLPSRRILDVNKEELSKKEAISNGGKELAVLYKVKCPALLSARHFSIGISLLR
ncbi:MAG: hypothetical protein ACI3YQ_09930 [Prevotella sp.]